MATYVIGDLQGCYDELQELLSHINFNPQQDQLWLTGDLVNRGPKSLECLRFVKNLGKQARIVLGNHDLSLLAVAYDARTLHKQDTFQDILAATDRNQLLDWLRQQPLLIHDEQLDYLMVHAGLPPQWTTHQAKTLAREVENELKSDRVDDLLLGMYGNEPNIWSNELNGIERLRFIINCFTRLRFCTAAGQLDLKAKGAPGSQADTLQPWFTVPNRQSQGTRIVFGHWSTLGCMQAQNAFSLDTGCLWGGALTAMRIDLETPEYFRIACQGYGLPG